MALNVETGTIVQPGTTGQQTYNLPAGFDPKVLILQCVARTANGGGSANAVYSFGVATDRGGVASQRYVMFASEDNIGTSDVYVGSGSADVVKLTTGLDATVDLEVAFVEFQSGAFVLDWQNLHTTASVEVYYTVIGGDGVEDALVGTFNTPAGTGVQDVTVASGFGQPDLVLFPVSWNGSDPPVTGNGDTCIGFGVKQASANGRCIRWGSNDAATTQASHQGIFNNRALHLGDAAAAEWAFELTADSAWPTDGFRTNFITKVGGGNWPVDFLAIRFSADVTVTHGEAAAATVLNGTNTLASSGTPKLALLLNTRQTAANAVDTTSTNAAAFGIGMVDGAGNERYAGAYDDDAQGTASVTGTYQTNAKGVQTWLPSTNALDGEADVAPSGSDFVATWTDQAPSAFLYEWVTLGEAGVVSRPPQARRATPRPQPLTRATFAR